MEGLTFYGLNNPDRITEYVESIAECLEGAISSEVNAL
jgi:hypothetical protein